MYFFGMRYYFPKNDADFKQHSIVNGGACVVRRLVLDPRTPSREEGRHRSQEKAALYQSFASSKRPGRARRTSLPWSLRITTRVSTWLDGWVGQNYSKDNMRCPREFMYFFGMRYYFPKNDADFKQHSIVNGGACVARRLVLDPREPPLVKKDGIVDLEYAPCPGFFSGSTTTSSAYCPKATISR
jgi:hypothetical protein